jgi:FAD-dependent urate hydroxylase
MAKALHMRAALQHRPIQLKVFEKAAALSSGGVGLSLKGGRYLLNLLDLSPQLNPIIHPLEHLTQITWNGRRTRRLGSINILETLDKAGLPPHLAPAGVVRSDLIRVLAESLPADCIQFSHELTEFQDFGGLGEVTAYFSNGSRHAFDVLIGADGINSVVREQLFGKATKVEYAKHGIWFGLADLGKTEQTRKIFEPLRGHLAQFLGNSEKSGYYLGYYPLGNQNKIGFWAAYPCSEELAEERWDLEASKKAFMDQLMRRGGGGEETAGYGLSNAPHPFPSLIENAERLVHMGLYYHRPRTKPWYKGRVVLIGDAAHVMLPYGGQSANQAIEDALVLSTGLLTDEKLEKVLEKYWQQRESKATSLNKMDIVMSRWELTENPIRAAVRNVLFSLLHVTGTLNKTMKSVWAPPRTDW